LLSANTADQKRIKLELDRCISMQIHISWYNNGADIVSTKFCQYISAVFAHKSVTLLLCMECSETQVATSSLALTD